MAVHILNEISSLILNYYHCKNIYNIHITIKFQDLFTSTRKNTETNPYKSNGSLFIVLEVLHFDFTLQRIWKSVEYQYYIAIAKVSRTAGGGASVSLQVRTWAAPIIFIRTVHIIPIQFLFCILFVLHSNLWRWREEGK